MALNGRSLPPDRLRLRRLPRLELAPMIDADNERRLREGGGRLDRRLPPPPHSLFHPLYPSLPLIHFRRDTRSWRRDPLRLGGRGGAWHHGVHHVQIGADDQLDQVSDGAVRGLLRGVRGDRQVRIEKEKSDLTDLNSPDPDDSRRFGSRRMKSSISFSPLTKL